MLKRIQRKRTKGWRMPGNTVSVTRPGRWGNIYHPGSGWARGFFDKDGNRCQLDVSDPAVQVKWFREWVEDMRRDNPDRFEKYIAPLRGKDLACWCKEGEPCHGDVLLEMASAEVTRRR